MSNTPLPAPWDYCYEWDGPFGTRKFSAASHNGSRPDRSVPIYTPDQMHTHAAAVTREKDAEIAGLRAELDARRKSGSASDRLHNICAAVEAEAGSSAFSREEWDRIDAENVALRAALRDLQSKLAASLRIPMLPWPDPGAHSHEATGRAIHASFCELRFVVINALSDARAALGDKT